MKAQIINTDFLHDGKYYSQNSIINVSPDLIKKYPGNLLIVDLFFDSEKENDSIVDNTNAKPVNNLAIEQLNNKINLPAGQAGSTANNMLAPSAELVKLKVSKKNKRGKK